MKTRFLGLLILMALATQAASASESPPVELLPSSDWLIDYADDRCRLARQFGSEDQKVIVMMDRYGPNEAFRLALVGPGITYPVEKSKATIQFGPAELEQNLDFIPGNLDKSPAMIFTGLVRVAPLSAADFVVVKKEPPFEEIKLGRVGDDRLKAIQHIRIGKPLRKTLILRTKSMRGPFAALDTCIDNLMASWGIDVAKHKALTKPALPANPPGNWLTTNDYPRKMVEERQGAVIDYRLSVDTKGLPTACHIQLTTRPKEFDDAVCKALLRRARFTPALDAENQPIASFYRNTVRFIIPG